MVLVTGGTGFLGAHLLEKLLQAGEHIRCIYRDQSFKYLHQDVIKKIEWVKGDLLDVIFLSHALQDVTQVYHCAGKVSFDPKEKETLFKINVEGTANIVNACIDHQIKKLVHVSSVAALGRSRLNKPINENIDWESHPNNTLYAKSKHQAEMEVWRGAGEGLPIAIVNPSIFIGPSLYWKEGAPKLIKNIADGFHYYTPGINGFTDVRDVASLMIQLMKSSVSNERFIINTANWSYKKLFITIKEELGLNTTFQPAGTFISGLVWRAAWLKARLTGKKQLITKETATTARQKVFYDNSKILKQFPGFQFIPLEQTVADAAKAFILQNPT